MKIVIEYQPLEPKVEPLEIKKAMYLKDFAIRIEFNDGKEQLVDFKPFLTNSSHPSIKKYLNETKFADFTVTNGNLNWNNYELIFPISDLYKGII